MNARSYINRCLIYVVVFAAVVVALNYAVDPYGMTGAKRVPGFNQYKVDINSYVRLYKKYQSTSKDINALIVGNSRVEMGLDPEHACLIESGWRTYNLGIPGAGVRRQLQYALNLIYQKPVEKIWLSVDFTDFVIGDKGRYRPYLPLQNDSSIPLHYLASGQKNHGFGLTRAKDYYRALFSLDALVSSLRTLAMQGQPGTDRTEMGFNPGRDTARALAIEGPAALFEQKMNALEKSYDRALFLREAQGDLASAFRDLADFLDIASARGIQVIVFINPFHQQYWDLLQRNSLLSLEREWREAVLDIVRQHGADNTQLWDFTLGAPYITEEVPPRGVKSGPLDWFWEPAHYRRTLGDLMLSSMEEAHCTTASDTIGERLH